MELGEAEVIKREMERTLKNENLNPSKHSRYLLSEVLFENFWDVEEKLHLLESLTFLNLEDFIQDHLSQLYVKGFFHGNFSKEEALHISDLFGNIFPVQRGPSVLSERRHKAKFLSLPTRVELFRDVRVKYEEERNSKVQLYFQIQPKPKGDVSLEKLRAVTELVYEILKTKFAESLRKDGFCYAAECEAHKSHCMMGIRFHALSPDDGPPYLQQ